jgi:hypothetical protein
MKIQYMGSSLKDEKFARNAFEIHVNTYYWKPGASKKIS